MTIIRINKKTGNKKKLSINSAYDELQKYDKIGFKSIKTWFPKPVTKAETSTFIYKLKKKKGI